MDMHFWLDPKMHKKIKAVKKWPDALLRSTEISQTPPMASGRLSGSPLLGSDMRNFGRSAPKSIQAATSSRPNGIAFGPQKHSYEN